MNKLITLLVMAVLLLSSTTAFSVEPKTPEAPPPANISSVDTDSGATCVTRPGKLEPLVLKPLKNGGYSQFLKTQNSWFTRWIEKAKTFFRSINPFAEKS